MNRKLGIEATILPCGTPANPESLRGWGYNLGGIGSALNPSSKFARKFPATFALASEVHNLRYGSMYSHPLIRNTGKPTGKISYKFLFKAKRLMRSSFAELSAQGLA